ncbi:MAG: GAF domain-containing protein [Pseudomonadota bacterium]
MEHIERSGRIPVEELSSVTESETSLLSQLDSIASTACDDLSADGVLINIVDRNTLVSLGRSLKGEAGSPERHHVATDTVCNRTISNGRILAVDDARSEPSLCNIDYVRKGLVAGYLGVPIGSPHAGKIGAICSYSTAPRRWSALEHRYMERAAAHVEAVLLHEMNRIEVRVISEDLAGYDRILGALSSRSPHPTSIYNQDGELAYVNAALAAHVPMEDVERYWTEFATKCQVPVGSNDMDAKLADFDQTLFVSTLSGNQVQFRVSHRPAKNGLIVCTWSRVPEMVN